MSAENTSKQPKTLSDKFFKDKDGRLILGQKPNIPIIVWVLSSIVARLVSDPEVQQWFRYLATISLVTWAVLEIGWGTTWFRRALGAAVLIFVIVGLLA